MTAKPRMVLYLDPTRDADILQGIQALRGKQRGNGVRVALRRWLEESRDGYVVAPATDPAAASIVRAAMQDLQLSARGRRFTELAALGAIADLHGIRLSIDGEKASLAVPAMPLENGRSVAASNPLAPLGVPEPPRKPPEGLLSDAPDVGRGFDEDIEEEHASALDMFASSFATFD